MLKQFSYSLLSSQELVASAERLLNCITDEQHESILTNRIKKTKETSEYLAKAMNESLSSVYASRVQEADLERDDAFQAFKYGLLSASFRSNKLVRQAGESLVEVVRRHGFSLYNLGYIAQSEAMRNLMEDMSMRSGDIQKSGVGSLLEEMVNANEKFNKIYHEKIEENTNQETTQIVVGKSELSKQLTLLLNHVELLIEDKHKGVEELVDRINKVITEMSSQARERHEAEQ